MDNISKYPKHWYKQLTHKKKPTKEKSEKSKSDKRYSSSQQVKPAKDKQEASENGDRAGGNKTDEEKETTTEWHADLTHEYYEWNGQSYYFIIPHQANFFC